VIDWDADCLGPVMAVFGGGVNYRPRTGAAFDIADAVFDAQYAYVVRDPQTGEDVTTTSPVLGVRSILFPTPPKQNDSVLIGASGVLYVVKDVQPDGHGHIRLLLNKKT
jgi:hypothetical protein